MGGVSATEGEEEGRAGFAAHTDKSTVACSSQHYIEGISSVLRETFAVRMMSKNNWILVL